MEITIKSSKSDIKWESDTPDRISISYVSANLPELREVLAQIDALAAVIRPAQGDETEQQPA